VCNQSRGTVLAEPFPGTVSQGFIHVLGVFNNPLQSDEMDFVHANHPVRTIVGAIPARIDIRIGIFRMNLLRAQ
jgi:hypothetical protein